MALLSKPLPPSLFATKTHTLSHLCRLLTASGCALSVASGEEGAAAARTAREEADDDDDEGTEEATEGSKSVGGAV